MNNEKRTITKSELQDFENHSKYFTTKVIENGTKQQIRFDTLNEVLEVSKNARSGYAIWVWIKGMIPLQVCNDKNELL